MLDEDFDADEIFREPDDYGFENDENDEDDIPELELGSKNRAHDLDISDDDNDEDSNFFI